MLDTLGELNHRTLEQFGDPETLTRMAQYEMAFRMQTSVPELTDLRQETAATLEMYGPDVTQARDIRRQRAAGKTIDRTGGASCAALTSRLGSARKSAARLAIPVRRHRSADRRAFDRPQTRGMLDKTLVVWGGEFGRTVYSQGTLTQDNYGRDHHPRNFCMWMAGGGIKGGQVYGETDDFSYNVVQKPVHVNDLNATLLHCLGIDHERFSVKFQGWIRD